MIRNIYDLADHFGVDASGTIAEVEDRLTRAIYRGTDCGAWIQSYPNSIVLGSIVEGSDAEFTEGLDYPFTGDDFDAKLAYLEEQCDHEWHRANEENANENE